MDISYSSPRKSIHQVRGASLRVWWVFPGPEGPRRTSSIWHVLKHLKVGAGLTAEERVADTGWALCVLLWTRVQRGRLCQTAPARSPFKSWPRRLTTWRRRPIPTEVSRSRAWASARDLNTEWAWTFHYYTDTYLNTLLTHQQYLTDRWSLIPEQPTLLVFLLLHWLLLLRLFHWTILISPALHVVVPRALFWDRFSNSSHSNTNSTHTQSCNPHLNADDAPNQNSFLNSKLTHQTQHLHLGI